MGEKLHVRMNKDIRNACNLIIHPLHLSIVAIKKGEIWSILGVAVVQKQLVWLNFKEFNTVWVEENQPTSFRPSWPYSMSRINNIVTSFNPEDYPHGLAICQWFLNHNFIDPLFGRKVLFTDKACFTWDGYFNCRNIWHDENPHGVIFRSLLGII